MVADNEKPRVIRSCRLGATEANELRELYGGILISSLCVHWYHKKVTYGG